MFGPGLPMDIVVAVRVCAFGSSLEETPGFGVFVRACRVTSSLFPAPSFRMAVRLALFAPAVEATVRVLAFLILRCQFLLEKREKKLAFPGVWICGYGKQGPTIKCGLACA